MSIRSGGLVSQNLTNCNSLTFITESEATHLDHLVMLLKANWDTSLNATNHLGKASGELWLLLLSDFTLIILFIGCDDFLDNGFLGDGVDMKNALITL